MNADGLDELVRVSARKVEYWAQAGGDFKFKHTMHRFAAHPRFQSAPLLRRRSHERRLRRPRLRRLGPRLGLAQPGRQPLRAGAGDRPLRPRRFARRTDPGRRRRDRAGRPRRRRGQGHPVVRSRAPAPRATTTSCRSRAGQSPACCGGSTTGSAARSSSDVDRRRQSRGRGPRSWAKPWSDARTVPGFGSAAHSQARPDRRRGRAVRHDAIEMPITTGLGGASWDSARSLRASRRTPPPGAAAADSA